MSPSSARNSHTFRIAVICHGNIARSQTLHHYLTRELAQLQIPADIFSCGTATSQSYSQDKELLAEVQQNLTARGLDVIVERTCWSDQAAQRVADSDIVLVADRNRRAEVLQRTGMPPERVHLFYEFIDEGPKDFTDTFDRKTGKQDPTRFAQLLRRTTTHRPTYRRKNRRRPPARITPGPPSCYHAGGPHQKESPQNANIHPQMPLCLGL